LTLGDGVSVTTPKSSAERRGPEQLSGT